MKTLIAVLFLGLTTVSLAGGRWGHSGISGPVLYSPLMGAPASAVVPVVENRRSVTVTRMPGCYRYVEKPRDYIVLMDAPVTWSGNVRVIEGVKITQPGVEVIVTYPRGWSTRYPGYREVRGGPQPGYIQGNPSFLRAPGRRH